MREKTRDRICCYAAVLVIAAAVVVQLCETAAMLPLARILIVHLENLRALTDHLIGLSCAMEILVPAMMERLNHVHLREVGERIFDRRPPLGPAWGPSWSSRYAQTSSSGLPAW